MRKGNILLHNTSISFGHSTIHLKEVTSTNDLAKQLISENLAGHGTFIRADYQSKGRGQEVSSWESERGLNLLCSLILFPQVPVSKQVYLNLVICLAVYDWALELLPEEQKVSIKWPNDIYVGDFKLAGILIENGIQGNEIKHCVAGMGINVNQREFNPNKACSIFGITGAHKDLGMVARLLLACLENRYRQLEQQEFSGLWNDYHRVLYKKDIPSSFTQGDHNFFGTPRGIDESGRLRMDVNGSEHYFQVKELIWN